MNIEAERFSKKAQSHLSHNNIIDLGFQGFDKIYRLPYEKYFEIVDLYSTGNTLDLCCGDGQLSPHLIKNDKNVTIYSIDLSFTSLRLFQNRLNSFLKFSPNCINADMTKLPFKRDSFDCICIAGSLSYASFNILFNEIKRVAKSNCRLIIVDSLNNNPIYFLYRLYQVIISKRSLLTLLRMPNCFTLMNINKRLKRKELFFYGAFTFLAKILSYILCNNFPRLVGENKGFMSFFSYKTIITGKLK